MTYCVAVVVNEGIAFCSDSRTNAGVDQINTYAKMFRFGIEGERQFVILSAGNLATTQAVITRLSKDIAQLHPTNLNTVTDLQEAAEYVGQVNVAVQSKTPGGMAYNATFLIGGQITGSPPQLAMVYPEGNYITAPRETPFLQIGESKYGKPILDRVIRSETRLEDAEKAVLLSMDSTLRSNLSVGMPLDLAVIERDGLCIARERRIEPEDAGFQALSRAWSDALRDSFQKIEPI